MGTDYNSRIKWLDKIVDFIDGQDGPGLEAWMKKYLGNAISALEQIIRKAGQKWIADVTAKVISINTENISGGEKLHRVLKALKDESIETVEELSTSDATTLINVIVTDLKNTGIIS